MVNNGKDAEVRPEALRAQALRIWRETLRLHGLAPETRIASSLSPIELLTCLYYGGILRYDARDPRREDRDRFLLSKGHGSIAMYAILADLGFFPREELDRIGRSGSRLGGIPDPTVPGYETINGSLGHGPGVACGIALALKRRNNPARVFVLVGDGELHEGACWEAVMFAGQHELSNLFLLVDNNGRCMLDFTRKVLDLDPLERKLREFGWRAESVDGHDVEAVMNALRSLTAADSRKPRALVARTVKGHGVPSLEVDPLCHVKSLRPEDVEALIGRTPDAR